MPIPTEDPEAATARDLVTEWLREGGYETRLAAEEEGIAWTVQAQRRGEAAILNVSQALADPERIIVIALVPFKETHPINRKADKEAGEAFVWDTRFLMLSLGVEGMHGVDYPLREVRLYGACYREGLTRREFWPALNKVRTAATALLWAVSKVLGQRPPSNGFDPPPAFISKTVH